MYYVEVAGHKHSSACTPTTPTTTPRPMNRHGRLLRVAIPWGGTLCRCQDNASVITCGSRPLRFGRRSSAIPSCWSWRPGRSRLRASVTTFFRTTYTSERSVARRRPPSPPPLILQPRSVCFRRVATPVERPLHARLFDALGVTDQDVLDTVPSPTNLAYMNHIELSVRVDGLACGVAALLPCPRIYHEVGKILQTPDNPVYGIWQSSYAEGLLEVSSAAWSELVDDMAAMSDPETRARMTSAYLTSARYEHMFWTMAYNQERWPA